MPHLLLSHLPQMSYPFAQGDYTFLACLASASDCSQLLWVRFCDIDFFLIAYRKDCKIVLKAHKQTAPTLTHVVQGALAVCKQAFCDSVLADNLATRAPKSMQSSHLLDVSALCALVAQNLGKDMRLEIGFGSGRRILKLACDNPDTLCIGVEIHRPSIEQVLRQMELQNLHNLWILKADARALLECLPSNCLSEIALHFPIPWPKRHRRVFTQSFCAHAHRVLQKGGRLHLRTDDEDYFRESLELLLRLPSCHCEIGKNRALDVVSKYESRWLRQQKQIWDLLFACEEECAQKDDVHFGFTTDDVAHLARLFGAGFAPSRHCEDGVLLAITALYRAESALVLSLCLGSVAYPQTVFLVISGATAFYCPALLPLGSNLVAHEWLKRRER